MVGVGGTGGGARATPRGRRLQPPHAALRRAAASSGSSAAGNGSTSPPLSPAAAAAALPNAVATCAALLPPPANFSSDLLPFRGLDSRVVYVSTSAVDATGLPMVAPSPQAAAAEAIFFIEVPLRDVSIIRYRGASSFTIDAGDSGVQQLIYNLTCPASPKGLIINGTYPSFVTLANGNATLFAAASPQELSLKLLNITSLAFSSPLYYINSPSAGSDTSVLAPVIGSPALSTVEPQRIGDAGFAYTFSAPCGGPYGALSFVCGPGSGGLPITFRCPAAEAVPMCLVWQDSGGGGGAWTPKGGCTVAATSLTTVTCACAASTLPLAVAVRFTTLPRVGPNIFAAVTPVLISRSVALEWAYFLLLLCVCSSGVLFAVIGCALDMRSARTFAKRFLRTPEGAALSALCAVTLREGAGEFLLEPWKKRPGSSRVAPAHGGSGGRGRIGAAAEWGGTGNGTGEGERHRRGSSRHSSHHQHHHRRRHHRALRSAAADDSDGGGEGGAHNRGSDSGSDSNGGGGYQSDDAASLLRSSHALDIFGVSSLFTPPPHKRSPRPAPLPPPTRASVAVDAVRLIGCGTGTAPTHLEKLALLTALPRQLRLRHPLRVAFPWLAALCAVGFAPLSWLWLYSTRLPRPTRVLMLLTSVLLALAVVGYSYALLLRKTSWYALPPPSLYAALPLAAIAAAVSGGSYTLLLRAAAAWVEPSYFEGKHPLLASELRRRRAIDAAFALLPSAEIYACLTVSKGGDVIKKGLAAAAKSGLYMVAPNIKQGLESEHFWSGNGGGGGGGGGSSSSSNAPTKTAAAASLPSSPPAAAPRTPAPAPKSSRIPSSSSTGARHHKQHGPRTPSADRSNPASPATPPATTHGFHVYESEALSMALEAMKIARAGAGEEGVHVSEDTNFSVEGLSDPAKAALSRLTLSARAVLRHECAPGLRELTRPPLAAVAGCRRSLWGAGLLICCAWCVIATVTFGLWFGSGALWGCVLSWAVGCGVAFCVLLPAARVAPMLQHLRHPPNPNHLSTVFAYLPPPLAPSLEHAIASAEAAACNGPLALGGGKRSAAYAPGALAATMSGKLLVQSYSFEQAATPLVAWVLLRQRAVAEAYLHSMLPSFGDAARVAAATLASNAWPAVAVAGAAANGAAIEGGKGGSGQVTR